jgi:hypothetical protein
MLRSIAVSIVFLLAVSSAGIAQEKTPPQKSGQQTAPQKPAQPAPDKPTEPAVQVPRTPAQLANIRIELTITDQRGTQPAGPKTVSMLVADRFNGRIRTSGNARVGNAFQPIVLNVDALPEILKDGRIRVQVSLEYRAQTAEGTQEDNQPANLTEAFSVILEDGKSLLVTQSADPATDRKVKIEMKATTLK